MRKFCISKDTVFAHPRPHLEECTPELLTSTMQLPRVEYICDQLHDLADKLEKGAIDQKAYSEQKSQLKKNLPFWTPMAFFLNGERKLRDSQGNPNAVASGLVMIDIDHLEDPLAVYKQFSSKIEDAGVAMVHITPSWHGLRIIFDAQTSNVVAEVARMVKLLGIKDDVDKACKDLSRASFIVAPKMVLYRNDYLLFKESSITSQPKTKVLSPPEHFSGGPGPLMFDGISYSKIIECWLEDNGGMPKEGARNNVLFRLACNLRYICDDNEELIFNIIPHCNLGEQELRQIIHHACSEAYRKQMPQGLLKAIEHARTATAGLIISDEDNQPPEMPKKLPRLIELLVSRTPDIYKPAVSNCVFPALAAHLFNTSFRYLDGELHEATLMSCLLAPTGAGKSCINKPLEYIMADIEQRDKASLLAEDEWKEKIRTMGANEEKPPRPKVCIQEISADITTAAFVLRLKQANGHFLFSKLNEIDQFDALKNGKLNEQFLIMCLAFDYNNRFGQTRVGADAVSSQVCVRYNWVASSTVQNGQKYFSKVLVNGPISRINFCTIPEREIGSEMPRYGVYDDDFRLSLMPFINNLNSAQGEIKCKPAEVLMQRLVKHCSDESVLRQDRIYENLSFRALVIAYLKACVLYVANGQKWEKEIEDFIQWSLDYDLWCKMRFFGDAIAEVMKEENKPRRGSKNLLEFLPDKFSISQVIELRKARNLKPQRENIMLSNWIHRGYIKKITESTFEKIKKCS